MGGAEGRGGEVYGRRENRQGMGNERNKKKMYTIA